MADAHQRRGCQYLDHRGGIPPASARALAIHAQETTTVKATAERLACLLALSALAACGTSSPGGTAAISTSCRGSVTIASELPTVGGDGAEGAEMQHGIQLAVQQANASRQSNGLDGCGVSWIRGNDGATGVAAESTTLAVRGLQSLAANQHVVGVIGPDSAPVAAAIMPIANTAGLSLISPTATDPGLTVVGTNPSIDTLALRPTGVPSFFRVCTTDLTQAATLANLAYAVLHARRAYLFTDQQPYGEDLSARFASDFEALGGTVVGSANLPPTTISYRPELTSAQASAADIVFFGGTNSGGGGLLAQQLRADGMTQPLLGGDGIVSASFASTVPAADDLIYATTSLADPAHLSSAAVFARQYAAVFGTAPDGDAAAAYDSAGILIQAAEEAIDSNDGVLPSSGLRATVRDNVAGISHQGALGPTHFDADGDTTNTLTAVWRLHGGEWTYDATVHQSLAS